MSRYTSQHERLHYRRPEDYGAYPIQVRPGYDSYTPLMEALQDCSDNGYHLRFGPGTWQVSQGLVNAGINHQISGVSANRSTIQCTNSAQDVLKLGPGASGSPPYPAGFIRDISVVGNTVRPDSKKAALVLDGLRFFEIHNVRANYTDIGFDLRNNCYGTYFDEAWASWDGVNVGVLLRGANNADGSVWGSGSDIVFGHCWFSGQKAGVWVHRDSGGYHFIGGQLSAGLGLSADNDNYGAVVYGIDYDDPAQIGGVGNMSFEHIDFEGGHRSWIFRGFGQTNMMVKDSSFLGTDPSANMLMGVYKSTNASNSQIRFENNNVQGDFSQVKLLNISGQGSAYCIMEGGTSFGTTTVGGASVTTGTTMMKQSNVSSLGFQFGREGGNAFQGIGNMRFRHINSRMDVSFDQGATYSPVTGAWGTTAQRPTTTYASQPYFDTTLNKPIWRNGANTGWVDSTGTTV